MSTPRVLWPLTLLALIASGAADAADPPTPADRSLQAHFEAEVEAIARGDLSGIATPALWGARRHVLRRELAEMLGLDPMPQRTDLKAVVTGRVDAPKFTIENVHFQSRPGLYVTGNLYLPRGQDHPAPAVLYVCGHAPVKKGDVSYGNKVAYQHHAAWFASNGYVCLVIDSLQLGEIEGVHHGTYRENLWWWNSRGYTPAGVEAWNCIRALDYLQSRKEVDGERLGVTGRSGGGAYTWWVSALDDRVKVAVPVAGITDVRNHVADGCVEGHCDCMFFVNTYRWDYPSVAALVAPRPLLITNTDKDSIFPLDGVTRLYWKVRGIYAVGVEDDPYHPLKKDIGLQVSEGGHVDSPELQVAAFRWFNRFLKGKDGPIDLSTATKPFEPEQLRVFKEGLPADAINGKVHETFVPAAPAPAVAQSAEAWAGQRDAWMKGLKEKCFRGWPADPGGLGVTEAFKAEKDGVVLRAYDYSVQQNLRLRLYLVHAAGVDRPEQVVCNLTDEPEWQSWLARLRPGFAEQLKGEQLPAPDEPAYARMPRMLKESKWAVAAVPPRGVGPSRWSGDEKKQTQIRRRFMLVGQTLAGMRVWDARRAVQALHSLPELGGAPLRLQAHEEMAGVALYASLYEPAVTHLHLANPPKSHMQGPDLLNVLRVLDLPQALAMAAENRPVRIYQEGTEGWDYAVQTAKALKWPEGRIEFRPAQPAQ